jgi:fumarylacetoacetase
VTDGTHDPRRRSWVESAQAPGTDFPIQNLPLGVFRRGGAGEPARIGAAIGEQVLDLGGLAREGLLAGPAAAACAGEDLNDLMASGPAVWHDLRGRLSRLLDVEVDRDVRGRVCAHLVAASDVQMLLPARIGDYTDFYASVDHAARMGRIFGREPPLSPNYSYVPVGYHGRASSIVVSGTPVRRPCGQRRPDPARAPLVGPTEQLDFELEVGFWVGPGNAMGEPIPIERAGGRLFGVCLLNDWSARDVQAWEAQPLGPFLGKNFATSVSPWVVTMEALEPYRGPVAARPPGHPAPLLYLSCADDARHGAIAITLQAFVSTRRMRADRMAPVEVCRSDLAALYWTPAQLVAHHTAGGCNLRPGDLLGSGTVSGPEARGCLLERTEPIVLPGGETRRFLEDGDEVILRGFAERPGAARIGLGECRGVVEGAAPGS